MTELIAISKIKNNPDNPRFIRDDNFRKLVQSLKDFPEMAEIRPVVLNMDMVILGGNMRYKAAKDAGWKEIHCIIVDWSIEKQREFIIKDNVSGGNWDWDVLSNEWDMAELDAWGVELPTDDKIDDLQDGEEIEFEQSVQIDPPAEYIIILAEPNSVEWEQIKETLQLKMVRRGGYKKGSAFDAVGIERVIRWDDFKERYKS